MFTEVSTLLELKLAISLRIRQEKNVNFLPCNHFYKSLCVCIIFFVFFFNSLFPYFFHFILFCVFVSFLFLFFSIGIFTHCLCTLCACNFNNFSIHIGVFFLSTIIITFQCFTSFYRHSCIHVVIVALTLFLQCSDIVILSLSFYFQPFFSHLLQLFRTLAVALV